MATPSRSSSLVSKASALRGTRQPPLQPSQVPESRRTPGEARIKKRLTIEEHRKQRSAQITKPQARETMKLTREMENLPEIFFRSLTIEMPTAEEIKKIATVKVFKVSGDRTESTVDDEALGGVGSRSICGSCSQVNCVGHFGYIDFYKPIYDPKYLEKNIISNIITSLCKSCARIRITQKDIKDNGIDKLSGSNRLKAIASLAEKVKCNRYSEDGDVERRCTHMGKIDVRATKESKVIVFRESKGSEDVAIFTAEEALTLFKQVSDEDARILGFKDASVLRRFIMSAMLVPPIQTRPPEIIRGVSQRNKQTILLEKIVIANEALKVAMDELRDRPQTTDKSVTNAVRGLYEAVHEYQDYIKSLIEGKDALIRNLMLGKRGDFCGRAVITPNDNIELGQVIVPSHMKSSLTPIELVTADNIEAIRKLANDGCITRKIHGSGPLKGMTQDFMPHDPFKIREGDVVYRHLMDGDVVVLDRQPSLHKQSMLGYTVVLNDRQKTLGIHLAVTRAKGADFDGDEMGIWLVQSALARTEIMERMYVCKNIMSSESNKPAIALTYDSITGAYLMSSDIEVPIDMILDVSNYYKETRQLSSLFDRLKKYGIRPNSGAALFSSILPEDFMYSRHRATISQGVLVSGRITGKHISDSQGSIIQDLHKMYGWQRTSNFITDATRVIRRFLDWYGFSVGYRDCEFEGVENLREKYLEKVREVGTAIESIDTLVDEGKLRESEREKRISGALIGLRGAGIEMIKSAFTGDNRIGIMSKDFGGGAKGSSLNAIQITLGPGTQYYNAKPLVMGEAGRLTNHYLFRDRSVQSFGTCVNGYSKGLEPEEMYSHFMGAREALSDTGTKVSVVGEIHRKMTKALQDIKTFSDNSVRNASGVVFQFCYGNDGLDGAHTMFTRVGSVEQVVFIDLDPYVRRYNAMYDWYPNDVRVLEKTELQEYESEYKSLFPKPERETTFNTVEIDPDMPEDVSSFFI